MPLSRLSAPYEFKLLLYGVVLADDVEKELHRFYNKTNGRGKLVFDLSDAEYIDVAALSTCITIIGGQCKLGLASRINIPRKKSVRDFLSVWRFWQALEAVTECPYREIAFAHDQAVWSEVQTSYTGRGNGVTALEYDADWCEGSLTKRNFFEFTTFKDSARNAISPIGTYRAAPRSESKYWTGALIREVLKRHFGGQSAREDIARVVIYEAISNSVRHPQARVIQIVSKFERPLKIEQTTSSDSDLGDDSRPTGHLRICIWDDGESISGTLRAPLLTGKSVKAFQLPPYMYDRIIVQERAFGGRFESTRVISQSEEPSKDWDEVSLLLSSLFPGISRAWALPVEEVEPFEDSLEGEKSAPIEWSYGMGLYSLCRTVLDQFQGSLIMRSGTVRLNMEMAHDTWRIQYSARYKCRITRYPQSVPPFNGNLLVINLPVSPEQS
ncbi:MAG: hypothetical protein NT002_00505 [candidate division Zixibacteria bacterium]|nr:hypothetical protein [candidate division Zixibacteria bacterium]